MPPSNGNTRLRDGAVPDATVPPQQAAPPPSPPEPEQAGPDLSVRPTPLLRQVEPAQDLQHGSSMLQPGPLDAAAGHGGVVLPDLATSSPAAEEAEEYILVNGRRVSGSLSSDATVSYQTALSHAARLNATGCVIM